MVTTGELERILEAAALPGLMVDEADEGRLAINGAVNTEEEHERALAVAREAAGASIEDNIEVLGTMPATIDEVRGRMDVDTEDRDLSEVETGTFDGATEGLREERLEPGDFTRDDDASTAAWVTSGPTSAVDDDIVSEGDVVFSPPVDPVMRRNPDTLEDEVLGGLASSSMDDLSVPRSALDGEYGDEAIASAVRRELREDAQTAELGGIEVRVSGGVVSLRGVVPLLDDAESAEEVASRVPGVVEVRELLDVEQYER